MYIYTHMYIYALRICTHIYNYLWLLSPRSAGEDLRIPHPCTCPQMYSLSDVFAIVFAINTYVYIYIYTHVVLYNITDMMTTIHY